VFWLVTTYARPLLGVLGAYFLNMTSPIVVTPKRTVLGWKHVFKPFSVRIGATVKPGRVTEKKIHKKATKVLYFPYLVEASLDRFDPKVAWWVMSKT